MAPRSVTTGGITLLCFPPYDRTFAALVERRFAGLAIRDPGALQATLRGVYPDVTVRPRESLAAFRPDEAWYVYRDGRYSPFADDDGWWGDPGTAYIDIDDDGRYVDANDAALELLQLGREELMAMRTGDLADPAAADVVTWTWAVLRETGELHSTSILRARGDRARLAVEYRLRFEGGGPGRHRSHLREIPLAGAEPGGSADPGDQD